MAAISHMTAILMMNSDIRHRYVSQIIGNQTLTKNKWLTVNCIILLKQLEKGEKHGWFSFMYINTYDVNYSPHQPHATRYQCSNSEMAATTDTPCVCRMSMLVVVSAKQQLFIHRSEENNEKRVLHFNTIQVTTQRVRSRASASLTHIIVCSCGYYLSTEND